MAIFGRRTISHWYDPATGNRAPATPLPTGPSWVPVYERDYSSTRRPIDWEALARPILSVALIVVLLVFAGWAITSFASWVSARTDSITWDTRCEKESSLCLTREKAKISKDFDVNVDASGAVNPNPSSKANMTIGPRAAAPAPIIVQAPPAPAPVIVQTPPAPAPTVIQAPAPRPANRGNVAKLADHGRCWMDPKGPYAGTLGYEWPDGRCHLKP